MIENRLISLPHICDFSLEDLIKDVGLYSPIQISTYSDDISYVGSSSYLKISRDVKQFYELIKINRPLLLPCAECKKELAFVRSNAVNEGITPQPMQLDVDKQTPTAVMSTPDHYSFFSETMLLNVKKEDTDRLHKSAETCKKVILEKVPFFIIELTCSLDSSHKIRCVFSLSSPSVDKSTFEKDSLFKRKKLLAMVQNSTPPEPTEDERDAIEYVNYASHTIILKKVGQIPSIADMQFFDLKKYEKVLKEHYRELTRGMGLYSSGVGIGAFVYLRRIFETLCENAHQLCKVKEGWDEDSYTSKRFNGKIEYLSQFGVQLIPDELTQIKTHLYSVMSKGVHEYSEEECLSLFPHALAAIELILDSQIATIEREKKIKTITSSIGNAN